MKANPIGDFAIRYRRSLMKLKKAVAEFFCRSIPFLMGAALILVWCGVLYKSAAPKASEMAMTVSKGQIERVITTSAVEALSKLTVDNYCTVSYGSSGEILAVTANTSAVSQAVSLVLEEVNEALSDLDYVTVSLPVGTLLGGELLSGRGFGLNYRAEPYCNLSASTDSYLDSAGINQVSHRIILKITANVSLICMGRTETFTAEVELPLAESVLVGSVPDGFFGQMT